MIAGVGSAHGADRLGWEVVDALRQCPLPPEVELYHCSAPAELSPLLLLSSHAIVIDAMLGAGPLGKVHVLGACDLPQTRFCSGVHGIGLDDAIRLALALGFEPRNLSVVALDVVQPDAVWDPGWVADLTQAVLSRLTEELENFS